MEAPSSKKGLEGQKPTVTVQKTPDDAGTWNSQKMCNKQTGKFRAVPENG